MIDPQALVESDIPRAVTALADWLAYVVMLTQLPARFRGGKRVLVYLGAFAALTLFMVKTAGYDGVVFNLFYAVSVLLMLLFLLAGNKANFNKTAYFCARAFMVAGLTCSTVWQLLVFFMPQVPALQHLGVFSVVSLLGDGGATAMFYFIENAHRQENAELEISGNAVLIAALMALAVYILSSISYTQLNTPFTANGTMERYSLRTVVYFGGVALLYAYHFQLCEIHTHNEVQALQTMLYLQQENYKINEETTALINRKYHDMKHQIALLRVEDDASRSAMLDKMENEIKAYEAQNHTGNKVLDTILSSKTLLCQGEGIQITAVADGTLLNFMDPMDVSALFGNALDNAIESVRRLPAKEQRLIHVSVARAKDFVNIRVENCFQGKLRFENGLPRTTKADSRYHGYGLKSIKATVAKYEGSTTVQTKECWFELRILIPLPENAAP